MDSQSRDKQDKSQQHILFMKTPKKDIEQDGVFVLERGKGVHVYDIDGKGYIDAIGGAGRANVVGYGREKIAKAMYNQAMAIHCHSARQTITPAGLEVSELVARLAPGDLSFVTYVSGGSDANETAFKIAKQYFYHQGEPQRTKIISRRGAYHGATLGALAATGSMSPMREINQPFVPGFYFIPAPTCYRCPFGREYPNCELDCAMALEDEILFEGPDQVAAFIVEPIMQSRGVQIPPPEYFPKIRSICDQYGVLLIDDEVITGFGRTGSWFCCEQLNFVPDLITFAKAFTSGYVPMGGVISSTKIAVSLPILMEIRTFSNHAVGCAAALANLKLIKQEDLPGRAKKVGRYLLDAMQSLREHPIVGDVRGIGMWCGIEFVSDKTNKTPFPENQNPAQFVTKKAKQLGLLIASVDQSIEISPPLIVERNEIDRIVQIVDKAISAYEKENDLSK
jgi:putrescine---pyruvate transaminase